LNKKAAAEAATFVRGEEELNREKWLRSSRGELLLNSPGCPQTLLASLAAVHGPRHRRVLADAG